MRSACPPTNETALAPVEVLREQHDDDDHPDAHDEHSEECAAFSRDCAAHAAREAF
jgi:hypothetical protein